MTDAPLKVSRVELDGYATWFHTYDSTLCRQLHPGAPVGERQIDSNLDPLSNLQDVLQAQEHA